MAFRRNLARTLLPKVFLLAVAFAWFAPGYMAPNWDKGTDEQVMAIRPQVQGSPAALVEKHDCWTGEAPADMVGKVPGHVVIRFEGSDAKLGGGRAVDIALAHIFNEPNPRVAEVYGFCR